ncbi:hypothetical protein C8R46DRAFT_1355809 [Mycena filopes]|nr:hypothetical protein C8R46DRAFT_1355809 [Mycena filopes]
MQSHGVDPPTAQEILAQVTVELESVTDRYHDLLDWTPDEIRPRPKTPDNLPPPLLTAPKPLPLAIPDSDAPPAPSDDRWDLAAQSQDYILASFRYGQARRELERATVRAQNRALEERERAEYEQKFRAGIDADLLAWEEENVAREKEIQSRKAEREVVELELQRVLARHRLARTAAQAERLEYPPIAVLEDDASDSSATSEMSMRVSPSPPSTPIRVTLPPSLDSGSPAPHASSGRQYLLRPVPQHMNDVSSYADDPDEDWFGPAGPALGGPEFADTKRATKSTK